MLTLHIGSVVQWIEFKIPVLTMKVRILSESLSVVQLIVQRFYLFYPQYTASAYVLQRYNISYILVSN